VFYKSLDVHFASIKPFAQAPLEFDFREVFREGCDNHRACCVEHPASHQNPLSPGTFHQPLPNNLSNFFEVSFIVISSLIITPFTLITF
jgi:hypothetical protein